MSQFKQMLQKAAEHINNDDDIENVVVIITKQPVNEKVEQHVLTNIACPLGHIVAQMQQAMESIVKEKVARLKPAANDPQES